MWWLVPLEGISCGAVKFVESQAADDTVSEFQGTHSSGASSHFTRYWETSPVPGRSKI